MNAEEMEQTLLHAFRAGTEHSELSATEDLLTRGTSSISIARSLMIAAELGVDIPVTEVYKRRTVRLLSEYQQPAGADGPSVSDISPLSPTAQFLMTDGRFGEHYNICDIWRIDHSQVDVDLLAESIAKVIQAIPSLNVSLERRVSEIVQARQPASLFTLVERVALNGLSDREFTESVERTASRIQRSFNFDLGESLIRVVFFDRVGGSSRLLICCHHLVLDGVGFRLFLREIARAYSATTARTPYRAAVSAADASSWAQRLLKYAAKEAVAELPYWRHLPWQTYAQFDLPQIYKSSADDRTPHFTEAAARALHSLNGRTEDAATEILFRDQCLVRRHLSVKASQLFFGSNVSRQYDAVLLAVALAFRHLSGQSSLLIDTFESLRGPVFDDHDSSRLIAYVNEIVPIPIELEADTDVEKLLERVKEQRSQVPMRGLGFRSLRYLATDIGAREEALRWSEPKIAVNYVASLQRDYPRGLLDLPIASEWAGIEVPEAGMPHWMSFTISASADALTIETRHQPKVVNYDGANEANRLVIHELERICTGLPETGKACLAS